MPKNKIKLDTPPHTPKQTKNKSKKKGKKRCKVSMETVMKADKVRSAQKQGQNNIFSQTQREREIWLWRAFIFMYPSSIQRHQFLQRIC